MSVWLCQLFDSGLLQFWSQWDFRLRDWQYKMESEKQASNLPTKASMTGNISVIFILGTGLLFGLALPAFLFELTYSQFKIYKNYIH